MARGKRTPHAAHHLPGDDISMMAVSIFTKIRDIKRNHADVSRAIDRAEKDIRKTLERIHGEVRKIDNKHDRDLVTVMVINGLHRMADEVLIE